MPFKDPATAAENRRRSRERCIEKRRESDKRYRTEYAAALKEKRRARLSDPVEREKESARAKFRAAVQRGWILRMPGYVFHHPDYGRPYFGCWVTQKDHQRIHAGLLSLPECVDYADIVETIRVAAKRAGASKGGSAACAKRWGSR